MKKTLSTLLLFLTNLLCLYAQHTSVESGKAYEYLQGERHKHDLVLGEAKIPSMDSLKKAEKILQDALVYYYTDKVQALAKTDKYLAVEKRILILICLL